MMSDFGRYAASQPRTTDNAESVGPKGVIQALPLALLLSSALWAIGILILLQFLHRI
jgi:hypothetical protein